MADQEKTRVCLIAVDGSKHSNHALEWFIKHVHKPNDRTILITCVDHSTAFAYGNVSMVPGNPDAITMAYRKEEHKARDLLKKLEELVLKHGVVAETLRVSGDAGEAIVKVAAEYEVDMIVTGCRGLGQIRRTMMGSVSDYIIHHSHTPVLVCRHD
ncbi:universal stress protein YxiE-like [Ylistrum balloti]|uniref:universal stress protein YxiE-like n=1 Tax=Ylistrum balloti TaxID=509963 RepID=UPI002905DB3C|nr:universal stress protein YxiE-like [Ylistrum balloti]